MVLYLTKSGIHTVFIPHLLKNHNYHVATSMFVRILNFSKGILFSSTYPLASITLLAILQFLECRVCQGVGF